METWVKYNYHNMKSLTAHDLKCTIQCCQFCFSMFRVLQPLSQSQVAFIAPNESLYILAVTTTYIFIFPLFLVALRHKHVHFMDKRKDSFVEYFLCARSRAYQVDPLSPQNIISVPAKETQKRIPCARKCTSCVHLNSQLAFSVPVDTFAPLNIL